MVKNKKFNIRYGMRNLKLFQILAIAAVVAMVILVWHWKKNDSSNSPSTTPTAVTKASPNYRATSLASPQSSNQVKNPATITGTKASDSLVAPTRVTYASNHTPSASTSTELSSFITTAGATAKIEFFRNGITKDLPNETADSNGSVTWYWSPKSVGLTSGSWTITATASLDNQTKSSSDITLLQVP